MKKVFYTLKTQKGEFIVGVTISIFKGEVLVEFNSDTKNCLKFTEREKSEEKRKEIIYALEEIEKIEEWAFENIFTNSENKKERFEEAKIKTKALLNNLGKVTGLILEEFN